MRKRLLMLLELILSIMGAESSVTQIVQTDRQGAVFTNMNIPPTADFNGRWVAVVKTIVRKI